MITNVLGNCCAFGIPGKLTPELAPREKSSPNCKAQELCWNVSQLFLYRMLQEIKWENSFHLNQQIIGKSLPGLIYTHKSIWLACWLSWVLAKWFAALPQPQVLGARCEMLYWNRQLTTSRGAWEAPCSLFPLTLSDSHDLSTDV